MAAAAAALLAGCASAPSPAATTESPAETLGPVTSAAIEHLGAAPCSDERVAELHAPSGEGLLCGTLTVPLDHADPSGPSLELEVVLQAGDRPEGVLTLLGGGPGGATGWTAAVLPLLMPGVASEYQFVAMDPRGTGADALDCPQAQAQVGSSDLLAPSPDAIVECAEQLGPRTALQSTEDTVADLELLRAALGVDDWVLDGTSYGTFVAQQYGQRHPDAVRALVLDSLVPIAGPDPFVLTSMSATPRVLGELCDAAACAFDPAAAVEQIIAAGYPAHPLLNAIVGMSAMDASYPRVLDALEAGAAGDTSLLDAVVDAVHTGGTAGSPRDFSSGAHIATMCADTPMPWGDAEVALAERGAALDAALAELRPEDTWPYPVSVAREIGVVQSCRHWPVTEFRAPITTPLTGFPILVLTGALDLSTPVENAEAAAMTLPDATFVTVPGAGHAAQMHPDGAAVVSEFLLSLDPR